MNNFDRFYSALGELILRWNQAEAEVKGLLIILSGAEERTGWILVAELSALKLESGVRCAECLAPEKIRPYIKHIVEWFGRLL